jgi:hypothetical protein
MAQQPRTMVANISGARLRDAERELAELKGESAVTEYIAAHPNETRVLQELVDMRRAGRNAPALARVQRAMLWSDGTIEFRAEPAAERGAGPRPGGPRTPFPGRGDGRRPGGGGRSGAAPRGGDGGRPRMSGPAPGSGPSSDRRSPASGYGAGRGGPAGSSGGFGAGRGGGPGSSGGYRPSPRGPRGPRRGGRDEGDGGVRGLPLSGEGWALVRPGEAPAPTPAQADEPAADSPPSPPETPAATT